MTKETNGMLVISEKNDSPSGDMRRASMGSPIARPLVLSRYLRGSTGSCHDLCKFGIKHDSEAAKHKFLKSRRKSSIAEYCQIRERANDKLEGKEKLAIHFTPSLDSLVVKKQDSLTTPVENVSIQLSEVIEVTQDCGTHSIANSVIDVTQDCGTESIANYVCLKPITLQKEGLTSDIVDAESIEALSIASSKVNDTQDGGFDPVENSAHLKPITSPREGPREGPRGDKVNAEAVGAISMTRPKRITQDCGTDSMENALHLKPVSFPKEGSTGEKMSTESVEAPSKTSPKSSSRRKDQKIRIIKEMKILGNEKEQSFALVNSSVSPKLSNRELKNNKQYRSASNHKKCSISKVEPKHLNFEKESKKTLHIVVPDAEKKVINPTLAGLRSFPKHRLSEIEKGSMSNRKITHHQLSPFSGKKKLRLSGNTPGMAKLPASCEKKNWRRITTQSSSSSSEPSPPASEIICQENTTPHNEAFERESQGPWPKEERQTRPSRGEASSSRAVEKDRQSQKVPFRRGKMVDPQLENSVPRKLRFRLPRQLSETQSGKIEAGRKGFRRKEIDAVIGVKGNRSEKVVLKHLSVEKKENARSLFNNVIEETASKLVETRKSKVKALVGAFETVISLQDRKPKATVTAC